MALLDQARTSDRLLAVLPVAAALLGAVALTYLFVYGASSQDLLLYGMVPAYLTLFVVAVRWPTVAFYLLVASLPLQAALTIDIGFTVYSAFPLLWLTVFAVTVHDRGFPLFRSSFLIPIAIFLVICLLSLVKAVMIPPPSLMGLPEAVGSRATVFRGLVQFLMVLSGVLTTWITIYFCHNNPKVFRRTLLVFAVSSTVVMSYGLYQVFAWYFDLPFKDITNAIRTSGRYLDEVMGVFQMSTGTRLLRPASTFAESNGLANYAVVIAPLLLAPRLWLPPSQDFLMRRRWLTLITAIAVTMLVLTFSRGGYLAFGLALIVILLGMRKGQQLFSLVFIGVLVLAVTYLLTVELNPDYRGGDLADVLFSRWSTGFEDPLEDQEMRLAKWQMALDMFSENPLIGVGLGYFSLRATALTGDAVLLAPNGHWASALSETGIIGFLAYYAMFLLPVLRLIRTMRHNRQSILFPIGLGMLGAMLGVLAHNSLIGSVRQYTWVWFLLGLIGALALLGERAARERAEAGEKAIEPADSVDTALAREGR